MAKENNKPNSYIYHRQWFNFQHENMDHVKTNHIALYLYIVEINNRLAWVKHFGITMRECMDGMRCKSRTTYSNTLHDLINWGFIKIVKPSKNQYQCNVIALPILRQDKLTFFDKSVIKNQEIYQKSLYKNYTGTGASTDTGTGASTDTIHQTSLQIYNTPISNNIAFVDVINFFVNSDIKRGLELSLKITGPDLEKMFEAFFKLKNETGKFDGKDCAGICEYFSNWLPGNLVIQNNLNKNKKNGTEHQSTIRAVVESNDNFFIEKYGLIPE